MASTKHPDKEKISNLSLNINNLLSYCDECSYYYEKVTDEYNDFVKSYSIELVKI